MNPTDSGVAFDLPCVSCGYNLKTLGWDTRCPECGAQVADSRNLELRTTGKIALQIAFVAFAVLAVGFATMAVHVGVFDPDMMLGWSRRQKVQPFFYECGPTVFISGLLFGRLLLGAVALHLLDLCVTGRQPQLQRHGGGFVGIAWVAALFVAAACLLLLSRPTSRLELLMFPAAEIVAAVSACQLLAIFADMATAVNRPDLSRSVRRLRVLVAASAVWTGMLVITFGAAVRWDLSRAEGLELVLEFLLVPWTVVAIAQAFMVRRVLRAVRPARPLERGAVSKVPPADRGRRSE